MILGDYVLFDKCSFEFNGFTCSNSVEIQGFADVKPVSYTPSLSPCHPSP